MSNSIEILKYIENRFSNTYLSTIGFDLKHKQITLKDGNQARLTIFDTAGQERFRSLAKNYLTKADGILLVYDISDENTFQSIGHWMDSVSEQIDDKIPIILIGNKSDLTEKRKVKTNEGKNRADEYGFPFYETSCKTGKNVNECFIELAELVYRKRGNKISQNSNQKLRKGSIKRKKKGCC